MLQECHNAAASLNAAGWYAEPRCRRRAGCRSLWKRHDKRHRRKRHFDERDSRHPNFEGANAELTGPFPIRGLLSTPSRLPPGSRRSNTLNTRLDAYSAFLSKKAL